MAKFSFCMPLNLAKRNFEAPYACSCKTSSTKQKHSLFHWCGFAHLQTHLHYVLHYNVPLFLLEKLRAKRSKKNPPNHHKPSSCRCKLWHFFYICKVLYYRQQLFGRAVFYYLSINASLAFLANLLLAVTSA